ncbi:unnamed protein product [Paramecium sonneborni]|uniref:Uncharacterized protein n=1 Tax=Paramecium sonneborni TaxID=65129 RepID=A0A8S1QPI7_9CILI|nr:unnamed protein product [Paramecium sonneborni]
MNDGKYSNRISFLDYVKFRQIDNTMLLNIYMNNLLKC